MPLFSYRATDGMGATQQGSIDALNADAARAALNEKGWTPIDVTEISSQPFSFVTPKASETRQTQSTQQTQQTQEAPQKDSIKQTTIQRTGKVYLPIASTLRLYAGWLLAYYALVYALGWYATSRDLPFEIPYVESLLVSPLVLSFTFAAFLFLLLHSLYQMWGKGLWKGMALGVVGVGVFVVYRMNVL